MNDKSRGIYEKFRVQRYDGQSEPGHRHDGCFYFVLDCDHDPHAAPALRAYMESCRAEYPMLASDIEDMLNVHAFTRAPPHE